MWYPLSGWHLWKLISWLPEPPLTESLHNMKKSLKSNYHIYTRMLYQWSIYLKVSLVHCKLFPVIEHWIWKWYRLHFYSIYWPQVKQPLWHYLIKLISDDLDFRLHWECKFGDSMETAQQCPLGHNLKRSVPSGWPSHTFHCKS